MDDVGWRHLIRKTAGKMIHIADYLDILNSEFDDRMTIEEAIKKMEEIFKASLGVEVAQQIEIIRDEQGANLPDL